MSEGSNRIIVRVECIHDELFEITGYHPVGAEHVSVSFALYIYYSGAVPCMHVWLVVGCDMK